MASKTFNTRLQLKYDSYTNWSTNNPVLLAGEVAVTTIQTAAGDAKQVPAVMMKVGDGSTAYNDLKFVSGLAANVHNWALAEAKPEYAASEITGLADYINGEIKDTNTTYQMVKVGDYEYKLQSKELDGTWSDVANSTITIPKYDDTQVKADIDALELLVGNTAVATQIANAIADLKLADTYDAKGAAASALTNAKAYTNELANGAVKSNTEAITAIKDGASIDSFKDVEDALATKGTEIATALQDAKDYADGKDAAIAAAKSAADKAQGEVDALEEVVGTPVEGKTVVKMVEDVQADVTAKDTEVRALIQANAEAIDAVEELVGTDVAEQISTAVTAEAERAEAAEKALADRATALEGKMTTAEGKISTLEGEMDNAEGRLDTLEGQITGLTGAMHFKGVETAIPEDVSSYVNGDVIIVGEKEFVFNDGAFVEFGDVSAEGDRLAALETHKTTYEAKVNTLETEMDEVQVAAAANKTAVEQAQAEVDAVEVRMGDAEGKIQALEADTHTHDNKALLDTYTQTEADLADAVDKKHDHANAAVLNGIDATDVSNWDAAKAGMDTLTEKVGEVPSDKTLVQMIADAQTAATYDDTQVKADIAANKEDIADHETRVATLEQKALLDGDTLILNCGNSVIA